MIQDRLREYIGGIKEESVMKRITAMILAGVLMAGSFGTVKAADFSDGVSVQTNRYVDDDLEYSVSAGEDTLTETVEKNNVDVKDSVLTGFEKALVFYPNTFYDFKVIGAGTQNAAPTAGDVRWIPLYWSLSSNPQEKNKFMLWKIGSVKGVYTDTEQAYDLYVFFQKEVYSGEIWEKGDAVEPVRYQFSAAPLSNKNENTYTIGGINYKISGKREVCVTGLKTKMSTVQIPASVSINGSSYQVTSVGQKAFYGNKKITGVVIGNNVTKIGKQAFGQCENLKTVRFGKKVDTISGSAFANCGKLTGFTLPASLKRIDAKAFYKCASVKTVKINSKKIESVGQKAMMINKKVTIKLPEKYAKKYQKLLKASGVYTGTKFVKF